MGAGGWAPRGAGNRDAQLTMLEKLLRVQADKVVMESEVDESARSREDVLSGRSGGAGPSLEGSRLPAHGPLTLPLLGGYRFRSNSVPPRPPDSLHMEGGARTPPPPAAAAGAGDGNRKKGPNAPFLEVSGSTSGRGTASEGGRQKEEKEGGGARGGLFGMMVDGVGESASPTRAAQPAAGQLTAGGARELRSRSMVCFFSLSR